MTEIEKFSQVLFTVGVAIPVLLFAGLIFYLRASSPSRRRREAGWYSKRA